MRVRSASWRALRRRDGLAASRGAAAMVLQHRRHRGFVRCCCDQLASVTDRRKSKMCAFRLAHRSCVMQRRSSWQFSRPPHCVASIGSSTATMMSATETVVGVAREVIAAARAAHAVDQPVAAQLAEQLLEVGQRDLLALGDAGERHRAVGAVHREVDHRRDGETSFGGQSHDRYPWSLTPLARSAVRGRFVHGHRTSINSRIDLVN